MDVELEFFKGQRENPIYAQPLNKTKEPKTKLSLFSAYVCTPPLHDSVGSLPALYDEYHLKPPVQGQPGP
jgi:hypothetical protein